MADPFFSSVSLLLHFDETNGSINIKDSSNSNLSIWRSGTASVSTAQSKFGGSSLFVEGTKSNIAFSGDNVTECGNGDFTIEAWVYPTATPNGEAIIAEQYLGIDNPVAIAFGFCGTTLASSGSNIFFGNFDGYSWTGIVAAGSTVTLNTWTHLAAVRESGILTLYRDGVSIASGSFGTYIGASKTTFVGRRWDTAATKNFFTGHIDEVRISKSLARYTSNFTPSSLAFEDEGHVSAFHSGETPQQGYTRALTVVQSSEHPIGEYSQRFSQLFTVSNGMDIAFTYRPSQAAWYPQEVLFTSNAAFFKVLSNGADIKYGTPLTVRYEPIWKNLAFIRNEIEGSSVQPSYRKPHRIVSSG